MKPATNSLASAVPSGSLVSLESILYTEELNRRPRRPPDYETENRALVALAQALADSPGTILQKLADTILEVFQCHSAGLSLMTEDEKRFHWPAIAGAWKPHVGGGTPRDFGPCGDVLDCNAPLLFKRFERRYSYLLEATPPAEEALLIPFYFQGKAVGTLWAMAHDDRRKFDAEDLRQLESVGRFASAAYQSVQLDQARDSRRAALNLMEDALLSRRAVEKLNLELRESERRFREMIDSLPTAIYTTDAEGYLTHFNPAAVEFSGRAPQLGTDRWCVSWKLYHPDGRPMAHSECPMAIALNEGRVIRGSEAIAERPDGTRIWFEPYPALLRDAEGRVAGGINMLVDITDRKRAEELRSRLAAIVESSADAIIGKDLDGNIQTWNAGAELLFGYTAQEAIGHSITILIPPDHIDEEPAILERVRRGERIEHYETIRCRKDGTLVALSLTISPIIDESGRITGASKIARDVTERKRAEEALHESAERLRFMAESMPQKIFTAKPNGEVDYFNLQWMEFTGLSFEQIRDWGWTQFIHPEDVEENVRLWQRSIDTGEPFQFTHRFRRADGVYRWHLSRAHPMRDDKGKILIWIGSNTEIHEQKEMEEALRRANENLRRANSDLEQFAYSASHDLQEPIRNVAIYGEIVSRRYAQILDAKGKESLGYITSAARRMGLLVKDLLTYAQTANASDETQEVCSAAAALSGALSNLSESIRESRAEITHDALPNVRLREIELQQLFQNLIGNAIKYRKDEEAPRIHLAVQRGGGGTWQFSVRDNGIGIAAEYKETVFGIFKRLHADPKYSGTGIGLAICQKIVERHDGRIWVESEVGEGTTFHFTLPVEAA